MVNDPETFATPSDVQKLRGRKSYPFGHSILLIGTMDLTSNYPKKLNIFG